MPIKIVLFEAPKLVSTKTLLLKHYYRRQGKIGKHKKQGNRKKARIGESGLSQRASDSRLNRVHAKGVVLCKRACFCLLSAF